MSTSQDDDYENEDFETYDEDFIVGQRQQVDLPKTQAKNTTNDEKKNNYIGEYCSLLCLSIYYITSEFNNFKIDIVVLLLTARQYKQPYIYVSMIMLLATKLMIFTNQNMSPLMRMLRGCAQLRSFATHQCIECRCQR